MHNPRAARTPEASLSFSGAQPAPDRIDKVTRSLEAAAYFPALGAHDPSSPNQANQNQVVSLLPFLRDRFLLAIDLDESLRHFEGNRMGRAAIADIHGRLAPIPDDFVPGPGLVPPPTILNPFRSQRLALLNGQLSFRDRRASSVRMFGTGRTFPVMVDGRPALKIGAVVDILVGAGDLAGLPNDTFPGATLVINGFIRPPDDLVLSLTLRVMDPTGRLQAGEHALPLVPSPALPDPGAVFMFLLGEVDPQRPVRLLFGPEGRPIGAQLVENLRLVRFTDGIETSGRLQSRTHFGPIVGTFSTMLYFDFQDPGRVIPFQTMGGVFSFHDQQGRSLGSLFANMVEGRAFRTSLPGAPMPVFRMGGFGPIKGGTGVLADATGMTSLNAVVSMFPRAHSNLHIFRIEDPDGRLRVRLEGVGLSEEAAR